MCVCLYSHRYVWWNPCCCLRQRLVTWSLAPATMLSKRIRTSAKDQLDSPVAMEKNTHQSSPWDRKLRSHHCKTLICILVNLTAGYFTVCIYLKYIPQFLIPWGYVWDRCMFLYIPSGYDSQFAMESHHAIQFGKPSISMGHLYHG